jgi:hypothetical protein
MKAYLLSLLAASILTILITLLAPEGERGGISKHVRLIASLFLVCVLLSPVQALLRTLPDLLRGEWIPSGEEETDDSHYKEQFEEAIGQASKDYFTDMLTQALCKELSLSGEDLQCRVVWEPTEREPTPARVIVTLSGQAIWKDPSQIRACVNTLVGCPCDVIIE